MPGQWDDKKLPNDRGADAGYLPMDSHYSNYGYPAVGNLIRRPSPMKDMARSALTDAVSGVFDPKYAAAEEPSEDAIADALAGEQDVFRDAPMEENIVKFPKKEGASGAINVGEPETDYVNKAIGLAGRFGLISVPGAQDQREREAHVGKAKPGLALPVAQAYDRVAGAMDADLEKEKALEEEAKVQGGARGLWRQKALSRGGSHDMSFLPEDLRPNYMHFSFDWEARLDQANRDGDVSDKDFLKATRLMKKFKKDTPGIERDIIGEKYADSEVVQVANAEQAQAKLDVDREIGVQQLEAADQMLNNENLWQQEHQEVQDELNVMRETAKVEREKLANIGEKHPVARIVGALASSLGAALGAYAATKAGTKNFAMEVIQAGLDKELGDAQVQLQKGQKVQNAMAQEMQLLSKKLGSTDQARRVMGMGILDRLQIQLQGMKLKSYSEADRTRIDTAIEQIDRRRGIFEKEYELHAVNYGKNQLAMRDASMRRFAGGMAKKAKQKIQGLTFVPGHTLGDVIATTGLDGRPMSGIYPKGTAARLEKRRLSYQKFDAAAAGIRAYHKKYGWDAMGMHFAQANPAGADARAYARDKQTLSMEAYQEKINNHSKVSDQDHKVGVVFVFDDTLGVEVDVLKTLDIVEKENYAGRQAATNAVMASKLYSGTTDVQDGKPGYRLVGANERALQGAVNAHDFYDLGTRKRKQPGE